MSRNGALPQHRRHSGQYDGDNGDDDDVADDNFAGGSQILNTFVEQAKKAGCNLRDMKIGTL